MPEAPLVISRSTWAAVERLVGGGLHAGSSSGSHGRGGTTESMILFRNDTGAELTAGKIVGLDGLVNTPATHPNDWDFYRVHKAVLPDPDQYAFALVMETVPAGKPGFALISGVGRVRVRVEKSDHRFARTVKNDTGVMESCAAGPARMIYRESSGGEGEALILFPLGVEDEAVRFGEMTSPPSTAQGEGRMKVGNDNEGFPVSDPMDLRPGQGDLVVAARDDEGKWSLVEAGRDAKLVKVLSGGGSTFTVRETSPSGMTWGQSFTAEGVD